MGEEKVTKKGHSLQLWHRLVVTDKDGTIISDTGNKEANSYVIQFLEFLYGLFRGVNVLATEVGGTEQAIYAATTECNDDFSANGGIGVYQFGNVVGTNAGVTPESNTDYKLDTQIIHGAGVGQLTHNVQTWDAPTVVGSNVDLVGKRSFTNNSGATITVKEIGIRVKYYLPWYHLIIRDVEPDTPIPDLCSLSVYYTLRTTVTV